MCDTNGVDYTYIHLVVNWKKCHLKNFVIFTRWLILLCVLLSIKVDQNSPPFLSILTPQKKMTMLLTSLNSD